MLSTMHVSDSCDAQELLSELTSLVFQPTGDSREEKTGEAKISAGAKQ